MAATIELFETTPTRPDGSRYAFVMLHGCPDGEDRVTAADSAAELLATLIPGYADLPQSSDGDDRALLARYDHAVSVATAVQASCAAQAAEAGDFDPTTEGEDVLTAVFTERTTPFTGIPQPNGARSRDWQHAVPLVLIDTDYMPYTRRAAPTGRIIWLRPAIEGEYLRSLDEVRYVSLLTYEGADTDFERPRVN